MTILIWIVVAAMGAAFAANTYVSTKAIDLAHLRHDKLMKRFQDEQLLRAKQGREIVALRHELLRVKSAVWKPKYVKETT